MPVTPVYSLPYPTDSDPVDVAGDVQALADAVETALATSGGTGGWRNTFLLMGA
jgi:hypothetical protein